MITFHFAEGKRHPDGYTASRDEGARCHRRTDPSRQSSTPTADQKGDNNIQLLTRVPQFPSARVATSKLKSARKAAALAAPDTDAWNAVVEN